MGTGAIWGFCGGQGSRTSDFIVFWVLEGRLVRLLTGFMSSELMIVDLYHRILIDGGDAWVPFLFLFSYQ